MSQGSEEEDSSLICFHRLKYIQAHGYKGLIDKRNSHLKVRDKHDRNLAIPFFVPRHLQINGQTQFANVHEPRVHGFNQRSNIVQNIGYYDHALGNNTHSLESEQRDPDWIPKNG